MKDKKASLRLQPRFEYSPFPLNDAQWAVLHTQKNRKVKSRSGEIMLISQVSNTEFIDAYVDNLAKWIHVSPPGRKMLKYILTIMPSQDSPVTVDTQRAMAFANYSSDVSVYDGLGDLVASRIIARSIIPGQYFINRNYFNGDNIVQFTHRITRSKDGFVEHIHDMAEQKENTGAYAGAEKQNEKKTGLYEKLLEMK